MTARWHRPSAARIAAALLVVAACVGIAHEVAPADALTTLAPPFHTSGNQILDANGHTVVFRGINDKELIDYTLPARPDLYTPASYDAIRSWGTTVVRVMLAEDFWLGDGQCPGYAGYRNLIDSIVSNITSRGMLAMVDLHNNPETGSATVVCTSGHLTYPGPTEMADAALSPTFWGSVAQRYGSNPLVAFDLFNEPQYLAPYDAGDPNGTTSWTIGYRAQIWHDGGLVRSHLPDHPPYQAAGMQQLYDAVRATGATNLVFVSGTRPQPDGVGSLAPGGYDLRVAANDPLVGTNIVYASHPYNGPNCTAIPADVDTAAMAVAATKPTMFTEFGTGCSNGLLGAQYMQNVVSYANGHGIGYVAYQWESYYSTSSYGLYVNNVGYSPSIVGQPIHDDLISH